MAHEAEGQIVWNVARQADGWPKGISDEDKHVLTRAAVSATAKYPRGLDLDQVYNVMRNDDEAKHALKDMCLWSYIYCTIERALRAAQCERVWVAQREYDEHWRDRLDSGQHECCYAKCKARAEYILGDGFGRVSFFCCTHYLEQRGGS